MPVVWCDCTPRQIWLTNWSTKKLSLLFQRCQCVVGKVSIHPLKALPIGSPNRSRWMGIGPRSGLWHRKTGHAGRKIRSLPPVEEVNPPKPEKDFPLVLHADTEGIRGAPQLRKRPLKLDKWWSNRLYKINWCFDSCFRNTFVVNLSEHVGQVWKK